MGTYDCPAGMGDINGVSGGNYSTQPTAPKGGIGEVKSPVDSFVEGNLGSTQPTGTPDVGKGPGFTGVDDSIGM